MIPEETHMRHPHAVVFVTASPAPPPPTCRRSSLQSLQAVLTRRGVVSGLGEAALAVVQHSSWRDNARGRDFTQPQVQVLNLLLLIGLQVLHLCQVSVIRKTGNSRLLMTSSKCPAEACRLNRSDKHVRSPFTKLL